MLLILKYADTIEAGFSEVISNYEPSPNKKR